MHLRIAQQEVQRLLTACGNRVCAANRVQNAGCGENRAPAPGRIVGVRCCFCIQQKDFGVLCCQRLLQVVSYTLKPQFAHSTFVFTAAYVVLVPTANTSMVLRG